MILIRLKLHKYTKGNVSIFYSKILQSLYLLISLGRNGTSVHDVPYLKESVSKLISQTPPMHSYKSLPNVRQFKVQVQPQMHPVFAEHGIQKRRYAPLMEWTYQKGLYNNWQILLLRKIWDLLNFNLYFFIVI